MFFAPLPSRYPEKVTELFILSLPKRSQECWLKSRTGLPWRNSGAMHLSLCCRTSSCGGVETTIMLWKPPASGVGRRIAWYIVLYYLTEGLSRPEYRFSPSLGSSRIRLSSVHQPPKDTCIQREWPRRKPYNTSAHDGRGLPTSFPQGQGAPLSRKAAWRGGLMPHR